MNNKASEWKQRRKIKNVFIHGGKFFLFFLMKLKYKDADSVKSDSKCYVHQQVLTDTWPAAESLSLELNLCVFTLH